MAAINYKSLLNFCVEKFTPNFSFYTVIIANGNTLRIYGLKRDHFGAGFQISYISQITEKPLNELIFCNSKNTEIFLLIERNNYDKSFIPKNLKSLIKINEFYSFSNVYSLKLHQLDFDNAFRDFAYHLHLSPKFDLQNNVCSNFEAMIYFTLNTSKLFFGEIIAILIPKNDQIFIYIFRRILFHFLLESNFVVPINFEITPNFLHFPQSIVKIVVKPFPNLQIAGKFDEIKTLPEILKEGFEIYENAKNEKALGICGTQKYFEVLEEAKLKSLLKRIYSSEVPLPVNILTNAKKKVVIEIQNDAMRICVMAKINGKQSEIIFQYPDNEQFIPMYISFLRKTVIIGKKAIEDYKTHPKFVIFDILKLVGKNLQNPPKINPKWHFQLVPLNAANHAKLGIKVQTFNGFKIFPVEIIFAILLKFLLKDIAAEYFQTTEFTLRFLQYKFTASEKNVFWAAAKLLNLSMILNCEN